MATTEIIPKYQSVTPQAQAAYQSATEAVSTLQAAQAQLDAGEYFSYTSPYANARHDSDFFKNKIESATAQQTAAKSAYDVSIRNDARGGASDISASAINAIRSQSSADSFTLLDTGGGENNVEDMFGMQQTYDNMMGEFTSQISGIENGDAMEVDYGASIAQIKSGFESNKEQIMGSALLGIQKQAMEADAYFGSAQSDQRSSARFKMASSMKNSMMQAAFGQIASVYDNQMKAIVGLQVDEQKTNAQLAVQKATLISDITGKASSLYANVFGTVSQSYTERLKASVQFASDQASQEMAILSYGQKQQELQFSRENANLQAAVTLLSSPGGSYYDSLYPVAQL